MIKYFNLFIIAFLLLYFVFNLFISETQNLNISLSRNFQFGGVSKLALNL